MGKTYIAVDIGASSGRVIKGNIVNDLIQLKEVHRFKNGMIKEKDMLRWDIDSLYEEIEKGLSTVETYDSIGIDTWGVDYVLLDHKDQIIEPVYTYRDARTEEVIHDFLDNYSSKDIYQRTGIQFLEFNTLFQLYVHYKEDPEIFNQAKTLLFIPDYLNFRFTGLKRNEYTVSTTSQMINIENKDWDNELLKAIGIKKELFPPLIQPGTLLAEKTDNAKVNVIAVGSHDTASAVAAVPAFGEEWAYISSGTWSLMGIESDEPICNEKALRYNFTNEAGTNGIRFLKNIMGLWLIQRVQKELSDQYSFEELVQLADESEEFYCLIHPNDHRFLNPTHMIEAIQDFCKETCQPIPKTPGQIARCIFESLAFQYKQVLMEIREVTGRQISTIHIVGGGCKNKLLNQLCANYTGCKVISGPDEATALGNLLVQMISSGEVENIAEGRKLIAKSTQLQTFEPQVITQLEDSWQKYIEL